MSNDRQNAGSAADALIEALQQEGVRDSVGTFTLDREVAREKMQRFGLAEPRSFVLELVQAAVLKEAVYIAVEADTDDVRVAFDGKALVQVDFDGLYNAPFEARDRPAQEARAQLAIALHAALSLQPRAIHVRSAGAAGHAELVLRPGQPDELRTDETPAKETGTLVHVKLGLDRQSPKRFVQNLAGGVEEELLLTERCVFSDVQIALEGRAISRGLSPPRLGGPHGQVTCRLEQPGLRGWASFADAARLHEARPAATRWLEHGQICFVKHGVLIACHALPSPWDGLIAVVEADAIEKDLSQRDVVRNDAYNDTLQAVHEVAFQIARRALRAYTDLHWLRHPNEQLPVRLAQVPLWPRSPYSRGGVVQVRKVSLTEIIRARDNGQRLSDFLQLSKLTPADRTYLSQLFDED